MKTNLLIFKSLLFLIIIVATSCSDDETVQSDSKQILSFGFTTKDNPELGTNINADLDLESDSILLMVPYGTDVTAFKSGNGTFRKCFG